MVRDREKTIIGLLSAIVVLLAVIIVAGGAAGLYGYREYNRLKAAVKPNPNEGLEESMQRVGDLLEDTTRRQEALSASLKKDAARTDERIAALAERRGKLQRMREGPMDKMSQTIELAQLMSDEMFALLDHLSRTQQSLARAMRPLPSQKRASEEREAAKARRPQEQQR